MKRFLLLTCAFLLLPAAMSAHPVKQQGVDYHRAFALLDTGHAEQAEAYAAHGGDPILNKVIHGVYLAQPNNDASFVELSNFLDQNPGWPGSKDIVAIAEQKIPAGYTSEQVLSWFDAHPARSLAGVYREVDALQATNRNDEIGPLVRKRWIEGDFTPQELPVFYNRYAQALGLEANATRLDRLLWKDEAGAARQMYAVITPAQQATAEARIALANRSGNAPNLVNALPNEAKNDPGLLFEMLRWDVRNNLDDQAVAILQRGIGAEGRPHEWWEQRETEIHRAMARRDYALAQDLAMRHGQTDPKYLCDAEFLAGWLDLRFLQRPEEATPHFQSLYDNASTPISRARGAYWLGRTFEALGDKASAEPWYETAAALDLTYYGQLAAAKLYPAPTIIARPEPTIPANIRAGFYNRDIVKAVERLHQLGERDRARSFFHAATEAAAMRADFAMLTELAYRIDRPDLAIEAAKAANQKNLMLAAGGYPLLDVALPAQPEPAFTHALIRQESMFNPAAGSPVGASGLMQLMPATALEVARKIGMTFSRKSGGLRLTDPMVSVKLGTFFVQSQIESFNGSYILALAGYNAGPRRVREWMDMMGDPRDAGVDPIDWVEEIPIDETRNYVERIMENLQVYRARLNGGQAPLLIIKDLRR